jgi:tRNA modification GTPase
LPDPGTDVKTIAAISTPIGRGGIGIIRLSGPQSNEISLQLSRRTRPWRPRYAHLAHWYDDDGQVLDSGIVLFFPAPDSYTGEDVVEFHGHGNPVLMQALIDRLFDLGAHQAAPGEFTRRAVEHGKMDLTQAEGVIASIDALTTRAAMQAQRHLAGEFGRCIERWLDSLSELLAQLEACLDFPEEDVPPLLFETLHRQVKDDLLQPIDALIRTSAFGERLFQGATVAILGAPNVGKSSLLNCLAARERAIVSEIPGTTRDTLEVDFEVCGIPMRLIDTAGLRKTDDTVEQEGVRRAKQAAQMADVVMFVADASRPETWHTSQKADLMVMNKMDLMGNHSIPNHFMPVSAIKGLGISEIKSRLARHLEQVPGQEEGLLVTRERHRQALVRTRRHLLKGLERLGREDELELVALEWHRARGCLGEIVGLGDIEEILDRIFAEFCIGK